MRARTTIAIGLALVLLVGTAAATPGQGPPDELPSPVPDFVGDLLGSIGDFVDSVLDGVGGPADGAPAGGALLLVGGRASA